MNARPLTDITAESICKTLPKECLDLLIRQEIDRRSVWVMANLVFATKNAALKWKDEYNKKSGGYYTDHEPMRTVLDEAPGEELYVCESENGFREYDNSVYGALCFIFTNKEQAIEANIFGVNPERYARVLVVGQWVNKKQ